MALFGTTNASEQDYGERCWWRREHGGMVRFRDALVGEEGISNKTLLARECAITDFDMVGSVDVVES